jgi:hypothetical protein
MKKSEILGNIKPSTKQSQTDNGEFEKSYSELMEKGGFDNVRAEADTRTKLLSSHMKKIGGSEISPEEHKEIVGELGKKEGSFLSKHLGNGGYTATTPGSSDNIKSYKSVMDHLTKYGKKIESHSKDNTSDFDHEAYTTPLGTHIVSFDKKDGNVASHYFKPSKVEKSIETDLEKADPKYGFGRKQAVVKVTRKDGTVFTRTQTVGQKTSEQKAKPGNITRRAATDLKNNSFKTEARKEIRDKKEDFSPLSDIEVHNRIVTMNKKAKEAPLKPSETKYHNALKEEKIKRTTPAKDEKIVTINLPKNHRFHASLNGRKAVLLNTKESSRFGDKNQYIEQGAHNLHLLDDNGRKEISAVSQVSVPLNGIEGYKDNFDYKSKGDKKVVTTPSTTKTEAMSLKHDDIKKLDLKTTMKHENDLHLQAGPLTSKLILMGVKEKGSDEYKALKAKLDSIEDQRYTLNRHRRDLLDSNQGTGGESTTTTVEVPTSKSPTASEGPKVSLQVTKKDGGKYAKSGQKTTEHNGHKTGDSVYFDVKGQTMKGTFKHMNVNVHSPNGYYVIRGNDGKLYERKPEYVAKSEKEVKRPVIGGPKKVANEVKTEAPKKSAYPSAAEANKMMKDAYSKKVATKKAK